VVESNLVEKWEDIERKNSNSIVFEISNDKLHLRNPTS
jgi:hypothetical protein